MPLITSTIPREARQNFRSRIRETSWVRRLSDKVGMSGIESDPPASATALAYRRLHSTSRRSLVQPHAQIHLKIRHQVSMWDSADESGMCFGITPKRRHEVNLEWKSRTRRSTTAKILLKCSSPNNGKGKTGGYVAQLGSIYGMKSSTFMENASCWVPMEWSTKTKSMTVST
jgi:hypothetical protein